MEHTGRKWPHERGAVPIPRRRTLRARALLTLQKYVKTSAPSIPPVMLLALTSQESGKRTDLWTLIYDRHSAGVATRNQSIAEDKLGTKTPSWINTSMLSLITLDPNKSSFALILTML